MALNKETKPDNYQWSEVEPYIFNREQVKIKYSEYINSLK